MGIVNDFVENIQLIFDFGFSDELSYHATSPNILFLDKSSGAFIQAAIKHKIDLKYLTSYQFIASAHSPLVVDYDQGQWGYGYGLLLEKNSPVKITTTLSLLILISLFSQ